MAKFETFEEIVVWQNAKELVLVIYAMFRGCRDYSFRDQIQRASVSIMNNIAEGFERKGNREFKKFLYISKGSCGEVRSMLYLAIDLKYISQESMNMITEKTLVISKMLSRLIKAL